MSIQIYNKYTYDRNFPRFLTEKRAPPPPHSQRPYNVSRGQNRYVTLP